MAKKDSLFDQSYGLVVVDKQYISSRWAGDAYTFICKFIELLTQGEVSNPEVNNENNQEIKEVKEEEEDKKEEVVSLI